MRALINSLAVLLTLFVIAMALDVFRRLGFNFYIEQYVAVATAVAIALVYLTVPASRGRSRQGPVPWYDLAAAIVGFAAALYLAVRFPELSQMVARRPLDGLVVAVILLLIFLEGLRRTVGLTLTIVAVAFFIAAVFGGRLPGDLEARSIPADRLTFFLVWDSSAVLGLPMKIVTSVVAIYVLFGNVLLKSGGSAFFTDISMGLMGRYRGGQAKISIVGSSLFGTISGSVVSNVLTVGIVTIPMMVKSGFRKHLAAAIEATASTGGQIMPPVMGIAAFIMAEFLQVPYADVALAALLPAILFYVALFIQTDFIAARSGLTRVPESDIPSLVTVLRKGWYFPIPFVILVYTLFALNYEPERAGLTATVAAAILAFLFPFEGKRINLHDIYVMLRDTGLAVLDLFMIGAAAGAIIGSLAYSGVGFSFALGLLHLSGGYLIALLVIAGIACIVLGMGMPTVGVYILLATLIAPALVQMEIEPMAAHLFIMYFGCLSMITPPVAIGAFAAANLIGADPMKTGFASMRFGWTVFVIPFLFVFSDTLLLNGPLWLIAIDFAAATIGVWFISAAMTGYSVRMLGVADRLIYGLAGVLVLIPLQAVPAGRVVNIVGAVLVVAVFAWEWLRRRTATAAAEGR